MQRLASHILGLLLVSMSAGSGRAAEPITPVLLTTFTNPTPAGSDLFGWSVASVGANLVIVGEPYDNASTNDSGTVYLLNTNGVLLTTFTNPSPGFFDRFGEAIAPFGSDRVLIGSPGDGTTAMEAGAAYLFQTNGALLATFAKPVPAEYDAFGYSMAAAGTDFVLIGSPQDNLTALNAGAVHVFNTNGIWLTNISNPTPEDGDWFGYRIAAVGVDKVMVGAWGDDAGATDAGAAYLFEVNGRLITTFTNPTPAPGDRFGWSLAAVGTNRVLIGAYQDDTGAIDSGAAYLFSHDGSLLLTFTNPTPQSSDNFGKSVSSVGDDRVLIGAFIDGTGAYEGGAAYLYSTKGGLLATITRPRPEIGDAFGWSVTALSRDRILIGALQVDEGANDAGAAYLFILSNNVPWLSGTYDDGHYSVKWLTDESLTLQQSDALGPAAVWTNTPELVVSNGLTNLVQQTVPVGVTNRYYRLRRP